MRATQPTPTAASGSRPAALDRGEVGLLRLVAQRLAGGGLASAGDVVAWLGAAQGQELPGALTSVALRTRARSLDHVIAALDGGEIVRSWPMRGTLHLAPAVDLPWMLGLVAPRVLAQTAARRRALGLDEEAVARARAVVTRALAGGRGLTRTEVLARWDEAGLAPAGGRGYHLLFHLGLDGVLCYGPMRGKEQELVLVEEWIPRPVELDRDEALGRLALRFFRSHGPATAKDLARWSGLLAADVRIGIAVAGAELARASVDGVEHLLDPATPDRLAAHRAPARGVFLLPGFDEVILGYGDRTHTLAKEYEQRVVPGRNGVFAPTVVADGRVVATWRHVGRGGGRRIETNAFDTLPAGLENAIEAAYAALP